MKNYNHKNKSRSLLLAFCYLLFLLLPTMLFAQKLNVTGKVTDIQGEPVIGATVLIEGTKTGVIKYRR